MQMLNNVDKSNYLLLNISTYFCIQAVDNSKAIYIQSNTGWNLLKPHNAEIMKELEIWEIK